MAVNQWRVFCIVLRKGAVRGLEKLWVVDALMSQSFV